MRVEEAIGIARPPETVWAVVADPRNEPRSDMRKVLPVSRERLPFVRRELLANLDSGASSQANGAVEAAPATSGRERSVSKAFGQEVGCVVGPFTPMSMAFRSREARSA
jgi:hypothetical protein